MRVNFMIVGMGKAGTTSLARWLADCRMVCFSEPKETGFFSNHEAFAKGFDFYHETFFPHFKGQPLIGEGTPAYAIRSDDLLVPRRIFDYNPEMKIILMVRHPLKRLVSGWRMWASFEPGQHNVHVNRQVEAAHKGFMPWFTHPELNGILVNSCRFNYQLDAFAAFGEERQHVIFLEDLEADKPAVLRRLAEFLGMDPEPLLAASRENHNTGAFRAQPSRLRRAFAANRLWQRVKGFVPAGLKRRLATSSLGARAITVQDAEWDPAIKAALIEQIRPDVHAFLDRFGKPRDFWKGI